MYQKVILIGNLGSDPEMKYMQDGSPVTNFSVATNRRWTVNGETKEETCWFRVSAYRGLAETCNNYLSKGRQVCVEGRLRPGPDGSPRVWSGSDGTARASFELVADNVRFLGGSEHASEPASGSKSAGGNPNKEQDEIPF